MFSVGQESVYASGVVMRTSEGSFWSGLFWLHNWILLRLKEQNERIVLELFN